MKQRLLPVLFPLLLCALSSCEYGVYCNVRNATPKPIRVTVVESIVQDKKAAKRRATPNPALDSFTLVQRDVPGTEYDKPVRQNFYAYTLPAGKDVNISSSVNGRLLSQVIMTQDADTLSILRHLGTEDPNGLAYYITVKPNEVSQQKRPQRKR